MDVGIAVVGAGPIGAATAYHLAERSDVVVVARPGSRAEDTFRQSGGSICWHRPDPVRAEAIADTARFVAAQVREGASIRMREAPYLLDRAGERLRPRSGQPPHIVCQLGSGYVYSFVKELDDGLRILVGQEDLVEDEVDGPVDHLPRLLAAGLAERLGYLAGARTIEVLWGTDFIGKDPVIVTDGAGLVSVTCGSAVRSCIDLGRRAARVATAALVPHQRGAADRPDQFSASR